MPNIFEKLFLPRKKVRVLKAVEDYNIVHNYYAWTEKFGRHTIEYNRSSNKFTVHTPELRIESSHEYSEKIERRLGPWDSQLRPTFYLLRVYGNNGQIALQEFDTTFAEKVYKKLVQKHHLMQNVR